MTAVPMPGYLRSAAISLDDLRAEVTRRETYVAQRELLNKLLNFIAPDNMASITLHAASGGWRTSRSRISLRQGVARSF